MTIPLELFIFADNSQLNMEDYSQYSRFYSDTALRDKLVRFGKKAGLKVVYGVLLLYYVLKSPTTKSGDRWKILGALGYFILPVDLIPDAIPIAGYTDDLAAIVWCVYCVAKSITPEIKSQAVAKLHDWFGDFDEKEVAEDQ